MSDPWKDKVSSETEQLSQLVLFEADDTVYWHRFLSLLLSPETDNIVVWDRNVRLKALRTKMLRKDNFLNVLF